MFKKLFFLLILLANPLFAEDSVVFFYQDRLASCTNTYVQKMLGEKNSQGWDLVEIIILRDCR